MMNSLESVQGMLDGYAQMHGQSYQLDEDGMCVFDIGDEMYVALQVPNDDVQYYLYAPLYVFPGEPNLQILSFALSLNMILLRAGGSSLALDTDTNSLTLCMAQDLVSIDQSGFNNILDNFIESVPEVFKEFASLVEMANSQVSEAVPETVSVPDSTPHMPGTFA